MSYANFWSRFAAWLLDGIILYIPNAIINAIVFSVFDFNAVLTKMQALSEKGEPVDEAEMMQAMSQFMAAFIPTIILVSVISTVLAWLYFALMESSAKQATLGKMALGIVVTDVNGKRISFARATGRFFSKALVSSILLVGYIMAAFTEKKQGLHDLIAGTLVMRQR